MRSVGDWQSIRDAVKSRGVLIPETAVCRPVGGGDISTAWRADSSDGPIFLKTGPREHLDMFQAEADGLEELRLAGAMLVPAVLASGSTESASFLILQWLKLESPTPATDRLSGRQLALLHRHTRGKFGWRRDNYIGSTPQHNDREDDWLTFFRDQRLAFQLGLAARNGFATALAADGARLIERLPDIIGDYQPEASLLHGDLWGGNCSVCGGRPVIYDPAVYYGDRETDLAMTHLFGGFGPEFYQGYETAWPLADGHRRREPLYQLYHVLNHLNLFGGSYLGRSLGLIRSLLRQSR